MACFCFFNVHAAYLRNIPMTLNQPDGTVLHCFASGDEFFNYLHDKDGFTIIQHPQTGYYVYAENRDGNLVATEYVAGIQDPASKGLKPFALISPEAWRTKRLAWKEPEKESQNRDNRDANHGTLNNISIFIRFSDDEQFTNSYYDIDNMFNDVSEDAVSLRSYFRAASYGAIEIPTTFYPGHNGNTIISYQDTYPRSYFEPYNSTTNPNGYQESQRAEREFSLLQRAVNYVNANYPVPTSLNIDYDEDGYVDNVCFIVKGGVGAWGSLLWPHKWSLYDRVVNINGKQVWTFNFQLADATSYFNTSTMCHEMNHSLGAPDLYHYYHGENLSPVGIWDLMEYNTTPPQHCGAYMKMKYGHWIDDIPEITQPGTYTLNPISSATPTNVAYKIATSDPNQFYVVEYRDNTSLFETGLPGKGLLVYRINTNFTGGVDYNPDEGIYDEVYIFRPGGTATQNGNYSQAYFSSDVGRPEFSSSTNPYPFFTDGTLDPSFMIYDITSAGNTISFTYGGTNGGSGEEIYIGDEGTNTNDYLPSFSYFNYSLTQQIYTAEEIGTAGTITSIAFFNGGATKTRTYDFYLVATDKTSFANNTDWVAVTDANKVFSGEVTMTAGGWTTIAFDRPFAYDGISNLILVTDDNTGSYTDSPHMSCRVFDGPSQALRIYSDGTNYDPFAPQDYSGTVLGVKNQLKMQIIIPADETVVIGEGGTNTNNYLPSYSYYNYSLTQQIYTADEIGSTGIIDGIGFYNAGATKTRIYDFYLVASDKTSFSGGDDWIAVTESDKVFSGIVAMTANNWTTIAFDKPFVYDGTSNLILVTDDNSGKYTISPHMSCRVFDAQSQAIRIYSDNTNYDPATPQDYSGSVLNLKNQIKMHVRDAGELFVIGDGDTTTNNYLPSFSYWNYSLSEQIYTANEIGTAGTIHSLAFYNGGETKTRTFDFYLMTTDKTSFVSNTDWIATTAADKVFSGEVNMVANEWTIIDFDTPFEYDGISNLILVTDDNSGEWTNSPHMSCRVYDAPQQAIRIYSDDTNYDPFNPTSYYGTTHNVKNQIVLVINPSLTFTKEINAYTNDGGYYLLSFPTSEVSPEEVEHMFDNIYDLYAFDESQPQEWLNYKAENFSLEPGKGYLYANSQDVTLSLNSTLYNGSGEVTLFKTVEAANAGWNLVGNPFAVTAYLDRDFYVMNVDGSEIIAAERDYVEPLEGVFVVAESNGEILTFSTTPSTKGQRLVLDLSKGTSISSATTVIDCAIVSFNDGSMLPKLQIKDNSNKLFIRQDGKEYAVANAGNVGEIPVSFRAESNGKYTISAHIQGVNLGYLHLIDTFTNSEIDLLSTSFYSFEASTSDDDERFKVVFAVDPGK
jgi:M6 family metalloprotease-like protein